jgi:hypothetical protein
MNLRAREIAALSTALPGGLGNVQHACMACVTVADEGKFLGAFDRASDTRCDNVPTYRRSTGGNLVHSHPGDLYVAISLPHAAALESCTPGQAINRLVRPLLAVLTRRAGARAAYFGRDWISMNHLPIAAVSMGHDSSSARVWFEAFVSVNTPGSAGWLSFEGREVSCLSAHAKSTLDAASLRTEVDQAYVQRYAPRIDVWDPTSDELEGRMHRSTPVTSDSEWLACEEEAVGLVGAIERENQVQLAGQFMASRDRVDRLNALLAEQSAWTEVTLGELLDQVFATPAMLFGVRSLKTLRDVILRAQASRT